MDCPAELSPQLTARRVKRRAGRRPEGAGSWARVRLCGSGCAGPVVRVRSTACEGAGSPISRQWGYRGPIYKEVGDSGLVGDPNLFDPGNAVFTDTPTSLKLVPLHPPPVHVLQSPADCAGAEEANRPCGRLALDRLVRRRSRCECRRWITPGRGGPAPVRRRSGAIERPASVRS
jgi:hypothetical protein